MKSKKERKFVLIMFIVSLVAGIVFGFLSANETEFFNLTSFLLVVGIVGGLLLFYVMLKVLNTKPSASADAKGSTVKGDKVAQYYDAAFISKSGDS